MHQPIKIKYKGVEITANVFKGQQGHYNLESFKNTISDIDWDTDSDKLNRVIMRDIGIIGVLLWEECQRVKDEVEY